MSSSAPVRSMRLRYREEVLEPQYVDQIHSKALEILRRVGVGVAGKRVLELLAEHGQDVDFATGRVRFTPEFVEEKRALAPTHFTLGARDPVRDLMLDGGARIPVS